MSFLKDADNQLLKAEDLPTEAELHHMLKSNELAGLAHKLREQHSINYREVL